MRLILAKDTKLPNAKKGQGHKALVPAGTHEIVEVPNPYGFSAPWYQIVGTKTGAATTWFVWAITYEGFPGRVERD